MRGINPLWALVAGITLLVSLDACAFGKKRSIPVDKEMDAFTADDATGLIEGCGTQPIVGFTYCRIIEGEAASQSLSFIGPPAKCASAESCAFIKVFNRGGQLTWGGSIPKGKTRVAVPWKDLLGSDAFHLGHQGQWTWVTEVHWTDRENHDRVSKAQGDIFLRVLKSGYTPLDRVSSDPAFAWTWTEGDFIYRMTTGLRTYVGRK